MSACFKGYNPKEIQLCNDIIKCNKNVSTFHDILQVIPKPEIICFNTYNLIQLNGITILNHLRHSFLNQFTYDFTRLVLLATIN